MKFNVNYPIIFNIANEYVVFNDNEPNEKQYLCKIDVHGYIEEFFIVGFKFLNKNLAKVGTHYVPGVAEGPARHTLARRVVF